MRDLSPYTQGLDLTKFALIIRSVRGKLLFIATRLPCHAPDADYYHYQCAFPAVSRSGGQPKSGIFDTAKQILAIRPNVTMSGTLVSEFAETLEQVKTAA